MESRYQPIEELRLIGNMRTAGCIVFVKSTTVQLLHAGAFGA